MSWRGGECDRDRQMSQEYGWPWSFVLVERPGQTAHCWLRRDDPPTCSAARLNAQSLLHGRATKPRERRLLHGDPNADRTVAGRIHPRLCLP